jgi:hypothetical protein
MDVDELAEEWLLLMTRLGFNGDTTLEMANNGIFGLDTLIEFTKDDLKTTLEHVMKYPHPARPAGSVVYISATAKQNIYAAVYWARIQLRFGIMPIPESLTQAQLVYSKLRIQELAAFKKSEDSQNIDKPPKLKKMSDWQKFWEASLTYFGSIRGAADIPLSYVFRDTREVTQQDLQATYPSNDARLSRCTVLMGTHFNTDSIRVWNEWKVLVQDGPGWDFVKRYETNKDGREAVLVLKTQQESMNGLTSRKNKAYSALETLAFSGPRRDWTFEQYVNGHLAAHNTLEQCDEPVAPAKKVKDFLENISDDRLSNAKDMVYADDTLMQDFDKAQQMLSLILTNKTNADKGQKRRGARISEVTINKKSKIDTKKSYSNDDWHNMSPDERALVIKARNDAKNLKKKGQRKIKKAQRKIAAAAAKAAAESSSDEDTAPEPEPTKDAGNQFGREAHNKKKKAKK